MLRHQEGKGKDDIGHAVVAEGQTGLQIHCQCPEERHLMNPAEQAVTPDLRLHIQGEIQRQLADGAVSKVNLFNVKSRDLKVVQSKFNGSLQKCQETCQAPAIQGAVG